MNSLEYELFYLKTLYAVTTKESVKKSIHDKIKEILEELEE